MPARRPAGRPAFPSGSKKKPPAAGRATTGLVAQEGRLPDAEDRVYENKKQGKRLDESKVQVNGGAVCEFREAVAEEESMRSTLGKTVLWGC